MEFPDRPQSAFVESDSSPNHFGQQFLVLTKEVNQTQLMAPVFMHCHPELASPVWSLLKESSFGQFCMHSLQIGKHFLKMITVLPPHAFSLVGIGLPLSCIAQLQF